MTYRQLLYAVALVTRDASNFIKVNKNLYGQEKKHFHDAKKQLILLLCKEFKYESNVVFQRGVNHPNLRKATLDGQTYFLETKPNPNTKQMHLRLDDSDVDYYLSKEEAGNRLIKFNFYFGLKDSVIFGDRLMFYHPQYAPKYDGQYKITSPIIENIDGLVKPTDEVKMSSRITFMNFTCYLTGFVDVIREKGTDYKHKQISVMEEFLFQNYDQEFFKKIEATV